jgi:predicted HD superfamily hydrolase involved in NAD metabolism
MDTAKQLASHWNIDTQKAILAACIHDAAKALSPQELTARNIILADDMQETYLHFPKVWHALIANEYAAIRFGIDDKDVLSAATWHTTGKSNMSPLDQIIFIADYIEPGRNVPLRPYIQSLAYENLDQATYALSTETLRHLLHKAAPLHPLGLDCRAFYLNQIGPEVAKDISRQLFK